MEKIHSMFRVVTHYLGAFRRPFFSSIGTQLGAKHPPPPHTHRELRLVLRLLKELPFVCGDGVGVGAFRKKIQRNLGVRVYTLFIFFFFFLCCGQRERRI